VKLRDLEAQLTKHSAPITTWSRLKAGIDPLRGNWTESDFEEVTGPKSVFTFVATLTEADGVLFICPKCAGTDRHRVRIGFRGIAELGSYGHNKKGEPVLWDMSGSGIDDLVLTPSIQLEGGCNWHGYVRNGDVVDA
jgi:Family of unknown function (DUF6527)